MTNIPTFQDGDVQEHHEREGLKGMSNEWFALIHKPISYQKAMQIEDARKTINKEWDKLEGYPAWEFETVMEKDQIINEAKAARLKSPDHQIHPSKTHSPMPFEKHAGGRNILVLQR